MKVLPRGSRGNGSGTKKIQPATGAIVSTSGTGEERQSSQVEQFAETQLEVPPSAGPTAETSVGDVISERYRLESVLGEGGMGKVFLAIDLLYANQFNDRKSEVAIKFLGSKFAVHDSARLALQRETRKSQQLSHPNVVRVMHFDQHQGEPYMIMEYMRGQPLDAFIRKHAAVEGLAFPRALEMIEGMAAGLGYIHSQGVVHSDFKPNNVFLGDDGIIKILDLGLARANEDTQKNQGETVFDANILGAMTPAYASCEMYEQLPPDPRDDVYALACVAYELLTGEHPYQRVESIRARARGLRAKRPPGLSSSRWAALERGLAFSREDRTSDVETFAAGLRGEQAKRRLIIGGLAVGVLLAIVASGFLGVLSNNSMGPDEQFLQSFGNNTPRTLSASDEKRIQNWLEQGNAYLQIAQQEYESGDLQSAHHILRTGADNAYRAFIDVLELQNSPQAKQGLLDMVNLYAQWATAQEAAGNDADAVFAACEGLKIHPRHEQLNSLKEDLVDRVPKDQMPVDC